MVLAQQAPPTAPSSPYNVQVADFYPHGTAEEQSLCYGYTDATGDIQFCSESVFGGCQQCPNCETEQMIVEQARPSRFSSVLLCGLCAEEGHYSPSDVDWYAHACALEDDWTTLPGRSTSSDLGDIPKDHHKSISVEEDITPVNQNFPTEDAPPQAEDDVFDFVTFDECLDDHEPAIDSNVDHINTSCHLHPPPLLSPPGASVITPLPAPVPPPKEKWQCAPGSVNEAFYSSMKAFDKVDR